MRQKIAKILISIILITSTLMFLPWIYMTGVYYIARYVIMAMMVAALILTFSLPDVLSVRFVRLIALTIALMGLLFLFLPIRPNDIIQLIITMLSVIIGICLKWDEHNWSDVIYYYTLSVSIVTICNCLFFAGNLKVPEYYMVNEGKNQIGAILAIGATASFYFGMKLRDQRTPLWAAAFLALLCVVLIRARSDFFAMLFCALLIIIKEADFHIKHGVKSILTILVISMSAVILYTGFIGDEMHTFMYGGKNSTTINEITSRRWIRNQQGMEILKHHNVVEEIKNPAKIPFIHNYPLLRLVRYGIFSLPLLLFYVYFALSAVYEVFRKRRSDVWQVGWIVCLIPLIISLAEPNFPYGPGLVQLPAFLLLGFSLSTHKRTLSKPINNTSKQVLHVCNDFNNSKVHTNLYAQLDGLGVRQTVFVPMRKKAKEANSFDAENTSFVYSHILNPLHRLFFFHKIEKTVKNIEKNVDLASVSVCHATTMFSDGMVAWELKRKYGIPYAVAVRNSDINAFLRYMPHLWWCHRAVLKDADKVFFITPSLKNRLLHHFTLSGMRDIVSSKCEIISNGINSYWIDNQKTKNKVDHQNRIVYAGNFSKNKNVLRLIDAVLGLRAEFPDIHLDIVGDNGADEVRIHQIAAKYPDTLTCHGRITDPVKMQALYDANDIFAMPSKSETFGLVYLEALSQGLPVLWSRGEAIDGMFDKKVGENVNPLSTNDIRDKIEKILKEYDKYETLSSEEFENFRWSNIAPRYIAVYQSIENQ